MDVFALIVIGGLLLTVVVLVALGLWSPRRALDITDKDRHTSWVTQAEIEEKDIPEMVDAQNARRRARGQEELTEGEFRRRAASEQRRSIARGKRARA